METEEVYGKVLCDIPAPELVQQGHILPPKVVIKKIQREDIVDSNVSTIVRTCYQQLMSNLWIRY